MLRITLEATQNLEDTIARLQSYQEAGAHVLYAPGLTTNARHAIRRARRGPARECFVHAGRTLCLEIFEAGGVRISVGSAIASAAQAAIVEAGRELFDQVTHGFWTKAIHGMGAVTAAMASQD